MDYETLMQIFASTLRLGTPLLLAGLAVLVAFLLEVLVAFLLEVLAVEVAAILLAILQLA